MRKFTVLAICDGWGSAPPGRGNAVEEARTPSFDSLKARWPSSALMANGGAVGLPEGQMGNSEVGHITIGAGRIVHQPLTRISKAIEDTEFQENEVIRNALSSKRVHLMGLLSDGGVHSHQDHLRALLEMASEMTNEIHIHAFLDGRDTPPRSSEGYLSVASKWVDEYRGCLSTLSGRYYSMDRDNRWERTQLAYDAIVRGNAPEFTSWNSAMADARANDENDEFVIPRTINGYKGLEPGDSVVFFNFRPDRIIQLAEALTAGEFEPIDISERPKISFASMMRISDGVNGSVAFPPITVDGTLGEIVSKHGRQLRISETEKYAHVTFFFNNGRRRPFEGEVRSMIPSPKVSTYDLKPEMSAFEVLDALIERLDEDFMLYVVNFANADMVGHTGNMTAAVKAVEAVDTCIGTLAREVMSRGGHFLMISDHGNSEQMVDPDGVRTAHTINPVPFICAGPGMEDGHARDGGLIDVAPTVLSLLDIEIPDEMTGRTLVARIT